MTSSVEDGSVHRVSMSDEKSKVQPRVQDLSRFTSYVSTSALAPHDAHVESHLSMLHLAPPTCPSPGPSPSLFPDYWAAGAFLPSEVSPSSCTSSSTFTFTSSSSFSIHSLICPPTTVILSRCFSLTNTQIIRVQRKERKHFNVFFMFFKRLTNKYIISVNISDINTFILRRNVDRPELCQISLYDFQKFLQMDQKVPSRLSPLRNDDSLRSLLLFSRLRPVSGVLGVGAEPRQRVPDGVHEGGGRSLSPCCSWMRWSKNTNLHGNWDKLFLTLLCFPSPVPDLPVL